MLVEHLFKTDNELFNSLFLDKDKDNVYTLLWGEDYDDLCMYIRKKTSRPFRDIKDIDIPSIITLKKDMKFDISPMIPESEEPCFVDFMKGTKFILICGDRLATNHPSKILDFEDTEYNNNIDIYLLECLEENSIINKGECNSTGFKILPLFNKEYIDSERFDWNRKEGIEL